MRTAFCGWCVAFAIQAVAAAAVLGFVWLMGWL